MMKEKNEDKYTNLFLEYGYSLDEIESRLNEIYYTVFYDEKERFYNILDEETACFIDDVRSKRYEERI